MIGRSLPGLAQDDADQKFKLPPAAPRTGQAAATPTPKKMVRLDDIDAPALRCTQIPVNPTDPIIIINGQVITRQQLADECVVRKGKEIAELMINRILVEQALRAKKLEVTAAEIDAGDRRRRQAVRHRPRRLAAHARQGARDQPGAVCPGHHLPGAGAAEAVRGRVQVTPKDMQQAFEAQYAEKIRCRMILVDTQAKAVAIWEELRKNPGGFEKIAMEQSMDTGSRSLGGLLAEPITRHAYPQTLTDAAFRQLVDGDPKTKTRATSPRTAVSPARSRSAKWSGLSSAANRSIRRSNGCQPERRAGA